MSVRLMLVRHGESEWNKQRLLQGQADVALSAQGRDQAAALGPTVKGLDPDFVVASDLARVRDTATLMGFSGFNIDAQLREIDVGVWQGRQIEELRGEDPDAYLGWRAGTYAPENGEMWNVFQARVMAAVGALLDAGNTRPLVVAHGGVIRAILDAFLGLTPSQIIPVSPASLTVVRLKHEMGALNGRLELFNFRPSGPVFDAPD